MRSVHALQRAMVRMLFDPAFTERVYSGPVNALSEPERELLVSVDRRAWTTDRYRRSRAVQALLEEFPVTGAVLGVVGVDAFFSTEAFAHTLSDRGSLALDFGTWATERASGIARLELSIARARRAEPRGAGIATRPGVEPVAIGQAHLALFSELRQRLGPTPLETFAAGWEPVALPDAGPLEFLLVERAEDGNIGIGGGSAALVALLTFASTGHERSDVEAEAVRLGCSASEATELVDDLLAEGLLVRG